MFIKDQSLAARNSAGDWRSGNSNDQHLATRKNGDPDETRNGARTLTYRRERPSDLDAWTYRIIAFTIMLVLSSLIVFALSRLLWPTLNSAHHIWRPRSPTSRSEAEQPQIDWAMGWAAKPDSECSSRLLQFLRGEFKTTAASDGCEEPQAL
jgi:hypothetical protein